jgi:hypothetical protein
MKNHMDQLNNHPLYKKHNIDSAMNSLWEFYKSRFLSLFFISLAMSLMVQYASTIVDIKELSTITDPMVMLEKLKDLIVPILIISLLNLFFNTILQYYIIYNPLNRTNNIFISAVKSMKYFIPYLIIMVLLMFFGAFAIILGVFALIIGAFFAMIYVMTLYLLVLPVLMIEGTNIAHAIRRTFALMHRNFWPNMGWVSVFLIILILVSFILSSLIMLPFTGSFLKTIMNPGDPSKMIDITTSPLFLVLSAGVGALTFPLLPILACILYFNGKATEEQMPRQVNPENEKVRVEDLYAKPYSDDHPENPSTKD